MDTVSRVKLPEATIVWEANGGCMNRCLSSAVQLS